MSKDKRYREYYGKLVIVTLIVTNLKFIAEYIGYEEQDDYDDNPCLSWYEFATYPLGRRLLQIGDSWVSDMTLYDPSSMSYIPLDVSEIKEDDRMTKSLIDKEVFFIKEVIDKK